MRVLVAQLDGALPNRACARLARHHADAGDEVSFRRIGNASALDRGLFEERFGRVYGSLIFERTRPLAERLRARFPDALIGGTGWSLRTRLEDVGVPTEGPLDYSPWPHVAHSLGFTQRGCRLSCKFCHVPEAEGAIREVATVTDLWRGDPWPRDVVLLDNDPFGQPRWRDRVAEIHDGGFRVSWTQGINMRLIDEEAAGALAGLFLAGRLWNDSFDRKAIYTAWDSRPDEARLFRGLEALERHGVDPKHVMVYVLAGFVRKCEPCRAVNDDDLYRVKRLRDFGAVPYPMPFDRDTRVHADRLDRVAEEARAANARSLMGLSRWTAGAYDKRIPWDAWAANRYRPEGLGVVEQEPAQRRLFA